MSTTKRVSYSDAAQILAARDSVVARLIEDAGPMSLSRANL